MNIQKQVAWLSRDVKQFLADPDFFHSLEYQCDAERFCRKHPNDVCSEDDLTDEGKAIRRYLMANPEVLDS